MNIAIDGPAGAGKSTIAKLVAKELGYVYVDTGAMYRAMAVFFLEKGVAPDDMEEIGRVCEQADISIAYKDGVQHVFLNGVDVTDRLRSEEVGNMASSSSANPAVRVRLVKLQQKMASEMSVVMDGRDIGTVVLPDAPLKIFLTASPEVRARRRYEELLQKAGEGEAVPDPEQIEKDIRERDERDMNRETSPLRQAADAVLVDSSDLTVQEVADRILSLAAERSA